ncbi:hypothetical protein NK6_5152 [Bradyrhizobium diazoefficiens]|uniref:Uncharacterized protein n=1 Tax=Bradyrhizobium diazoefficiens TaxID=1355477 RepID=A0A0E4BRG9_9BRAD|nr:hypothetical protein NK6_5152 [Bradyrhizobium diazoefficiens]
MELFRSRQLRSIRSIPRQNSFVKCKYLMYYSDYRYN